MSTIADLSLRIAEEAATLPLEKQSSVLDFVLFVKQQAADAGGIQSEGDAAWERIINDPVLEAKAGRLYGKGSRRR